jgi:EAL domain-containing protein (putative c-di-GMP-specific phosphodiesterase class I)
LRGADTVSRLGGDEFAVLLCGVAVADCKEAAARIHEALAEPILIEGLLVSVGASIGIAFSPMHGDTVSALLRHADVAMYESKRGGRSYEVYDPDSDPNNAERLSLATDLRKALQTNALVLHYQPQMDLGTGELAGVEALLRWQHPSLGLLGAERFMALAEQIGLASAISEHALVTAIRQCGDWRRNGLNLHVAVNLDVRTLLDLEFRERITAHLDEFEVDGEQIELEITETSLMTDPVRVRRVAHELAETGFQLAIDDFGTGYSSLNYLSQLPISRLKIDQSFVGAMTTSHRERVIVGATIDLAHNLGLEVVAEGVEDETTLELLRELGSDFAQGYHIGLPVDAGSFVPLDSDWIAA